ncbi:MAG: glycosyltransferase, partial [Solirubrobacteraceae bacterium]
DMERIVSEHRVGVVLADEAPEELARVVAEARALASDAEVQARCRRVARMLFDVDRGSARYAELYRQILGAARP